MSTTVLIGLIPAPCSRAAIHEGDLAIVTSATAAAYRGHRTSSAIATLSCSDLPESVGFSPIFAPASVDGRVTGRVEQRGRFACRAR